MRESVCLVAFGCLLGCAGPPPPATFGETCVANADCESGACAASDRFCTQECSGTCPAGYVCGPSGFCERPCSTGSTQGSGASREICVDGLYVACSTRDAASACASCGCEPFGGGTCAEGSGCIVPQPDGSPCTSNVGCTSGTCYRDTSVCGPPRAMGEPCTLDSECETQNCSTDGDYSSPGVCNQELGTECTGFGRTATCTNCFEWDSILPAVCAREHCGPDAACPQLGVSERVWSCELSTDGSQRCYEQCDPESSYRCFDSGDFCRSNGYCG